MTSCSTGKKLDCVQSGLRPFYAIIFVPNYYFLFITPAKRTENRSKNSLLHKRVTISATARGTLVNY